MFNRNIIKGSMIRMLACVLAALMVFSLCVPQVYAAKKVKVKKITLSTIGALRVGHSKSFSVKITPTKATNKKLKWTSSNTKIAKVSSKGKVTALKPGTVTITAKATDGSKKKASKKIIVYKKLSKNSLLWISHRGYHKNNGEVENTAGAFRAAVKLGYKGIETDVIETKPNDDGEIELVLNHDDTFKRVQGVDRVVNEMTYEEIVGNPALENVCTLEEYVQICKANNMVPFIELKYITDKGAERMIGILERLDMLDKAVIISSKYMLLDVVREYASLNGKKVKIGLTISTWNKDHSDDILKYDYVCGVSQFPHIYRTRSTLSFFKDNNIPFFAFSLTNSQSKYDNDIYNMAVKKKYPLAGIMTEDKCWA